MITFEVRTVLGGIRPYSFMIQARDYVHALDLVEERLDGCDYGTVEIQALN